MKRIMSAAALGLVLLAPTAFASAAPVQTSISTVAVAQAPAESVAHRQAVRMAKQYLDYTAFSRSGVIRQLRYEGFSKSVATSAVDSLKVSWYKQAKRMARQYLDYTAFSRSGLVRQLKHEGFTDKQARYGAKAVGLTKGDAGGADQTKTAAQEAVEARAACFIAMDQAARRGEDIDLHQCDSVGL